MKRAWTKYCNIYNV